MTDGNSSEGPGAGEVQEAHMRFLETLDCVNRDIHGSSTREQMLKDVLETVLGLFGCDLAFLAYPCEPGAVSWRPVMEAHKPEFTPFYALGAEVPLDTYVAGNFRALLAADGPLTFGPGGDLPLNEEFQGRLKINSMLAAAIYPGGEKPYMLGVLQCSGPRVWSKDEKDLLTEVGRRLADGMTSMAAYLALRENEAKYRRMLDTASEGVLVLDVSGRVTFLNARLAALFGCKAEEGIGRPLARLPDLVDVRAHDVVVAYGLEQERAVAQYHAYQVIEIVRYAAGQVPNGFHLLRLQELRFQLLAVGYILAGHDQAADGAALVLEHDIVPQHRAFGPACPGAWRLRRKCPGL